MIYLAVLLFLYFFLFFCIAKLCLFDFIVKPRELIIYYLFLSVSFYNFIALFSY